MATPTTMGADGTSASSIVAKIVDGGGNPVTAPSAITFTLGNSNPTSCNLSSNTIIPAGASDSSSNPGSVFATTTPGACSISGTASGGFTGTVVPVTVTTNALGGISLPAEVLAPPAGSVTFTVTLTTPAPAGGATVNLITTDASIATVSASVSFAAGATAATATLTGVKAGSTSITASSSNYASTSTLATIEIVTVSFVDQSGYTNNYLSMAMGTTAQRAAKLSAAAPQGGLTLTLSSNTPTLATVDASAFVPAGQLTSSFFTVTGVSQGTASVTASNGAVTTGTLTVGVGSPQALSVSDGGGGYLGAGLHRNFTLSLNWPAPAGGVAVTLSGFNPAVANVVTTSFTIPAGQSYHYFEVDGIAAGATAVTASASGWTSSSSNFTVVNPTLTFSGPSSPVTTLTTSDAFTIYVQNPNCYYCDYVTAATTISFGVNSTVAGIVPTPASMVVSAGTYYVSGQVGQATAGGTYTLTASATSLAGAPSITSSSIVVNQPSLTVSDNGGYLGAGLHRNFSVSLSNPAPAGGLPVTITGFATAVANVPTSTFTVPAGQSYGYFEVDGIASGATSVTAAASGWNSATSNFTVLNPTLTFSGPYGPVTTLTPSDAFTVYVQNPNCYYCDSVTAATTISFSVNSTVPGIVPTPASLVMSAGTYYVSGQVGQATAGGSYTLTASGASLAGAPSITSGSIVVNQPSLTVSDHNGFVGVGLHRNFTVSLSNAAPAGGLVVSLGSTDPTVASVPSTVTVGAGAYSANFEVDGLRAATTTITVSASAWTGDGANITVVNPILTFSSPSTPVTTLTPTDGFTVYVQNPNCYYCDVVSAATTITFTVNSAVAGIVPTPTSVVMAAGAYYVVGQVGQATTTGTYTLTATTTGLAGNPSVTSNPVVVNTPSLTVSDNNGFLGAGMHRSFYVSLSNPAPAGGLPVTISGFATGTANVPSASFTVAVGQSSAYFEVDGIAAGSTSVTASAPAWIGATSNFTVVNPVLAFSGPNTPVTTATTSDGFAVYVQNPNCNYCDVVNASTTIAFAVNSSSTGIVPTPANLVVSAGQYSISGQVGQATVSGTYTLTATAATLPGSPSATSGTVTVS